MSRASSQSAGIAESATGGLLAATLTDPPRIGASKIFECGFVTYSNNSKVNLLHVDQQVLNEVGPVSPPVAKAMVEGILKNCPLVDLALSITGLAGPGGGTPTKPVGLVYFGVASKRKKIPQVHNRIFNDNDRRTVRFKAVRTALQLLIDAALS